MEVKNLAEEPSVEEKVVAEAKKIFELPRYNDVSIIMLGYVLQPNPPFPLPRKFMLVTPKSRISVYNLTQMTNTSQWELLMEQSVCTTLFPGNSFP